MHAPAKRDSTRGRSNGKVNRDRAFAFFPWLVSVSDTCWTVQSTVRWNKVQYEYELYVFRLVYSYLSSMFALRVFYNFIASGVWRAMNRRDRGHSDKHQNKGLRGIGGTISGHSEICPCKIPRCGFGCYYSIKILLGSGPYHDGIVVCGNVLGSAPNVFGLH